MSAEDGEARHAPRNDARPARTNGPPRAAGPLDAGVAKGSLLGELPAEEDPGCRVHRAPASRRPGGEKTGLLEALRSRPRSGGRRTRSPRPTRVRPAGGTPAEELRGRELRRATGRPRDRPVAALEAGDGPAPRDLQGAASGDLAAPGVGRPSGSLPRPRAREPLEREILTSWPARSAGRPRHTNRCLASAAGRSTWMRARDPHRMTVIHHCVH